MFAIVADIIMQTPLRHAAVVPPFELMLLISCVLGVFLAWSVDSVSSTRWVFGKVLGFMDVEDGDIMSKLLSESQAYVEAFLSMFPEVWVAYWRKLWSKLVFGLEAWRMKRISKSMNHFQVLCGKLALGLPVDQEEDEVKSYLDIKRYMGEEWPFMWTMNKVRSMNAVEVNDVPCTVYSSYSYLELVRDERVQERAIQCARQYASGNHGPRMLGGNTVILRELEQKLARWLGREDALCLSAGYLACMSSIAGVARPGDVIFADNRAHASLRAGMKLSGAKTIFFQHNDFEDAEKVVKKNRKKFKNAWMVIESVYSMDGDVGYLPAAAKLCEANNIRIILDEAHGLGVLGATGRGAEEHFNMRGAATLIVGTFSKSFASVGGYIVGSKDMIEFLDFHAPGNVFSAPLSAYHAGAAMAALEIIQSEQWRVKHVQENSAYLRNALETGLGLWPKDYPEDSKYEVEGDPATSVIPVVFLNDPIRVLRLADKLRRMGIAVAAVCAPACPVRRPRFRVTATCGYTKEMMDTFVTTLVKTVVDTPKCIPKEFI